MATAKPKDAAAAAPQQRIQTRPQWSNPMMMGDTPAGTNNVFNGPQVLVAASFIPAPVRLEKCAVCQSNAILTCDRCGVGYCGAAHQSAHSTQKEACDRAVERSIRGTFHQLAVHDDVIVTDNKLTDPIYTECEIAQKDLCAGARLPIPADSPPIWKLSALKWTGEKAPKTADGEVWFFTMDTPGGVRSFAVKFWPNTTPKWAVHKEIAFMSAMSQMNQRGIVGIRAIVLKDEKTAAFPANVYPFAACMDRVQGCGLRAWIAACPSESERNFVVREIISELNFLHHYNICHLDCGPHNFLIGVDGMPYLIDFFRSEYHQSHIRFRFEKTVMPPTDGTDVKTPAAAISDDATNFSNVLDTIFPLSSMSIDHSIATVRSMLRIPRDPRFSFQQLAAAMDGRLFATVVTPFGTLVRAARPLRTSALLTAPSPLNATHNVIILRDLLNVIEPHPTDVQAAVGAVARRQLESHMVRKAQIDKLIKPALAQPPAPPKPASAADPDEPEIWDLFGPSPAKIKAGEAKTNSTASKGGATTDDAAATTTAAATAGAVSGDGKTSTAMGGGATDAAAPSKTRATAEVVTAAAHPPKPVLASDDKNAKPAALALQPAEATDTTAAKPNDLAAKTTPTAAKPGSTDDGKKTGDAAVASGLKLKAATTAGGGADGRAATPAVAASTLAAAAGTTESGRVTASKAKSTDESLIAALIAANTDGAPIVIVAESIVVPAGLLDLAATKAVVFIVSDLMKFS